MKRFMFSISLFLLNGCGSSPSETSQSDSPLFNVPSYETTIIRIATSSDPQTLDSRKIRDLPTVTILHLLQEGLVRRTFEGKIVPGLAEKFTLDSDLKTYTFTLRPCHWSNGDPITAQDFRETWLSALDPSFPAPNAYQFFLIKGAKQFKTGKGSSESLGIYAPDERTLIVELDEPAPYFLDLASSHFFYPVHESMRDSRLRKNSPVISSGPFVLVSWKKNNELIFVKNPSYWAKTEVVADKIKTFVLDERTALQMFQNQELDWAGSPMSDIPQDALASLSKDRVLRTSQAAGTTWLRFNTTKPPFNNRKMRKALSYAIDRQSIVDHVTQGFQKPATGIVPPALKGDGSPFFEDNNVTKAWELFQEALIEMKLDQDSLPKIVLSYSSGDRYHKIAQAVQQQWRKNLGLEVYLQSEENKTYYSHLAVGDFQISAGSWFADFADPLNFLEIFNSKTNATNNTYWETAAFSNLLLQSSLQPNPTKRLELLKEAEILLMDEMPVVPLFYSNFNYVRKDNLYGVYFSEMGYLDFRNAYYEFFNTVD